MKRTQIAPKLRRERLRAYPERGRSGLADHALAALESFTMAGLASCHPATVERGLREVRALLAVVRAAASDPDPHHRVEAALSRLRRLSETKKGDRR